MGSLIGHIVPGTIFVIYGIYMIVRIFWEYYHAVFTAKADDAEDVKVQTGNNNNSGLKNQLGRERVSRNGRRKNRPNRIPPAMSFFKLISITCGMLGEYLTALDENWNFVEVHNGQHMTMFAFFFFNTMFELFYHYDLPGLPPQMDTLTGVVAFTVEGVLFLWHLHGRSMLDVQVHTFLVYAIGMCVVGGLLEIQYPGDIRPMLVTNGAVLLQGAWFYGVGMILYPPAGWQHWDPKSHSHSMWATMSFAWTIGGVIFFQMVTAMIVYRIVKRRVGFAYASRGGDGYSQLEQQDRCAGLKLLLEEEDEEEDSAA